MPVMIRVNCSGVISHHSECNRDFDYSTVFADEKQGRGFQIDHGNTDLAFDLLEERCEGLFELDGEVMGAVGHCSNVRYAIIEASSMKDHPERLVIAYPNESCLRDVIAVPSIVGLGFKSREEAITSLFGSDTDSSCLETNASRQSYISQASTEINCEGTCGLDEKDRKMSFRILQCALATAILVLYSQNLVSAMIRMTLGFPS